MGFPPEDGIKDYSLANGRCVCEIANNSLQITEKEKRGT